MRVLEDLLNEHGVNDDEIQEAMIERTGNTGFYLGYDSDMDESSDREDPEKAAKDTAAAHAQELADRSQFLEAVRGALESRAKDSA